MEVVIGNEYFPSPPMTKRDILYQAEYIGTHGGSLNKNGILFRHVPPHLIDDIRFKKYTGEESANQPEPKDNDNNPS